MWTDEIYKYINWIKYLKLKTVIHINSINTEITIAKINGWKAIVVASSTEVIYANSPDTLIYEAVHKLCEIQISTLYEFYLWWTLHYFCKS